MLKSGKGATTRALVRANKINLAFPGFIGLCQAPSLSRGCWSGQWTSKVLTPVNCHDIFRKKKIIVLATPSPPK